MSRILTHISFGLLLIGLVGSSGGSELGQPSPGTSVSLSNEVETVPAVTAPAAARTLDEASLIGLLTEALAEQTRNRGELQLRLTRKWDSVPVPEGEVTARVLSLPVAGIMPHCILRFEIRAGEVLVGSYQAAVQASIMNDVWVARTALKRGEPFDPANFARERRDVINLRDVLTELPDTSVEMELADYVAAKGVLTSRALRARPVVARGDMVDASASSGALNLRLKVEVLEAGAPGQLVRVRNPQSRRELYGKITNDRTIELPL
jgi:flagella basal body P-ring formation protein FlgA